MEPPKVSRLPRWLTLSSDGNLWLQTFLIAFGAAFIMFLPIVIMDHGYFTFYGDFNVQQIPFYRLVHEAIRSGNFGWNWYTDLGSSLIGSYSFYIIFSPFFWLTLPFPTAWTAFFMAPLFVLKIACMAATAYLLLARFVKDKRYALLGGLLYAFSSFTVYNIFFNHFLEPMVFFPLMLLGLEKLVVDNKRGLFALFTAVNAMVNYWFFIGEVVFVIIYFCVRCTSPDFRMTVRKFISVAFEAILGVALGMFALLPSVLAIMGNPRTTGDNILAGWNLIFYWENQKLAYIFQSFFFPPELPSRPNFFVGAEAKWSSTAAWLPLFSTSGVFAFILARKNNWLKKLVIILAVMAAFPGLNSLFIGLNNSFYSRWFYMFVLILALATVIALERRNTDVDFYKGIKITGIITWLVVVVIGLLPRRLDTGGFKFGLEEYPALFWAYAAIALLCVIGTFVLIRYVKPARFFRFAVSGVLVVSLLYGTLFLQLGHYFSGDQDFLINTCIKAPYDGLELPKETDYTMTGKALPDNQFYRYDTYNIMENIGMFWSIPNIQCFQSTVSVSIMDFYPYIGVKRDVSSKPDTTFYTLRPFLSVKYLIIQANDGNQEPMPGYSLVSSSKGYNFYKNELYVPMGFTFDKYMTTKDFDTINKTNRANVLMQALVLNDDQAAKYGSLMTQVDDSIGYWLDYNDFGQYCMQRKATAGYSFVTTTGGFESKIILPKENLVFYSVPYDKGWTAYVNGVKTDIEKVDVGFMAVKAPAGDNEIVFKYATPGLKLGLLVSGASILLLLAYVFVYRRFFRAKYLIRAKIETYDGEAMAEAEAGNAAPDDIDAMYQNPDETHPAQAGPESAASHVDEELIGPPENNAELPEESDELPETPPEDNDAGEGEE